MSTPPPPPPEAVLLRLVRKAARVTVEQTAKSAGISKAWLSSIENGYDNRGTRGGLRPVRAKDDIIATLADYLDVSPERLETEGQRPDAAAVLREIHRRRRKQQSREAADDRPPVVRKHWDDPMVRELWAIEYPKLRVKEDWVRSYLNNRDAGTAAPVRRRA